MRTAVVALIIKDGLILSISRRNNKTKFGLIGGKVDVGETLEQALVRETREEAGIELISYQEIYVREEAPEVEGGEAFYTYCYYALAWSGDPQDSEEGVVKWMTAKELTSESGAFAEYNAKTLSFFKEMFPLIKLQ